MRASEWQPLTCMDAGKREPLHRNRLRLPRALHRYRRHMRCCQTVSLPQSLGLTLLAYLGIRQPVATLCPSESGVALPLPLLDSAGLALGADSKRANYQRFGRSGEGSSSRRHRSQSTSSAGYDPFTRSDWSYSTPRRRPRGAKLLSELLSIGPTACCITACTHGQAKELHCPRNGTHDDSRLQAACTRPWAG